MSTISQLNGQDRLRAIAAAAALRTNTPDQSSGSPARWPDSVSISETARSMVAASKAVASAPDVRQDKVDALKAAIADGSYSIDSRRLAATLLTRLGS
jgi:negative regulator of flagellin synthesis FlgM